MTTSKLTDPSTSEFPKVVTLDGYFLMIISIARATRAHGTDEFLRAAKIRDEDRSS